MLVFFPMPLRASSDSGEKENVWAGNGKSPRIVAMLFRFEALADGIIVRVCEKSSSERPTVPQFLSASLNSERIIPLKSECFIMSSGSNSFFGLERRFTIFFWFLNARRFSFTLSSSEGFPAEGKRKWEGVLLSEVWRRSFYSLEDLSALDAVLGAYLTGLSPKLPEGGGIIISRIVSLGVNFSDSRFGEWTGEGDSILKRGNLSVAGVCWPLLKGLGLAFSVAGEIAPPPTR